MNFSDRLDNSSVEILMGYYYTVRLNGIVCHILCKYPRLDTCTELDFSIFVCSCKTREVHASSPNYATSLTFSTHQLSLQQNFRIPESVTPLSKRHDNETGHVTLTTAGIMGLHSPGIAFGLFYIS